MTPRCDPPYPCVRLRITRLQGPELLNMYIGESEHNLRDIFARARAAAPCVLFFDEIDALAPARGLASDSSAVMDRMVAQLLTEIDACQQQATRPPDEEQLPAHDDCVARQEAQVECIPHPQQWLLPPSAAGTSYRSEDTVAQAHAASQRSNKLVFIVAATNRPDLLDTALLRPGRFDRMVYMGLPVSVPAKAQILTALTRKFDLSPDVDLDAVAAACSPLLSGADLYGVVSCAFQRAVHDTIAQHRAVPDPSPAATTSVRSDSGTCASGASSREDARVRLHQHVLLQCARTAAPSITAAELQHYESLRERFHAISASSDLAAV
ncbi:ATP-binding protein [archaeon]|nr:MAG: ATP-binding protein [archaeon]